MYGTARFSTPRIFCDLQPVPNAMMGLIRHTYNYVARPEVGQIGNWDQALIVWKAGFFAGVAGAGFLSPFRRAIKP